MADTRTHPLLWQEKTVPDPEVVDRIAAATTLPRPICVLLAQRGYIDIDDIRAYLKPDLSRLHDPFQMRDMSLVVERLLRAYRSGEPVFIHGDYDVDGLSSTALFTRVLARLGFDVEPFVPDRHIDGYGISLRALERAAEEGYRLVLTCDVGVSAHDEIRTATQNLGLEVLVTDHHQLSNRLPPAGAVINPHRSDCLYPFKGLCGVGVAFKVLQALVRAMGRSEAEDLYPYLDLVALGSVADVVPLLDENRVFVHFGLRRLRETGIVGLRALIEVAELAPERLTERAISHALGPRLNAIGRLDRSSIGLRLLLTDDADEARDLARILNQANAERQEVQRAIERDAIDQVLRMGDLDPIWAIALFGETWHHGVVGIVANRTVEHFGRPAFLFAPTENLEWKGSGRAPKSGNPRLDLHDILMECRDHLVTFVPESATDWADRLRTNLETVCSLLSAARPVLADELRAIADQLPSDLDAAGLLALAGVARDVRFFADRVVQADPPLDRDLVVSVEDLARASVRRVIKVYRFGGHRAAAGATLAFPYCDLETRREYGRHVFAAAFNEAARRVMVEEDRLPRITIDEEIRLSDITPELYRYLRRFSPFGEGNDPVCFATRGVNVARVRVLKEEHIELLVEQDGVMFRALGWRMANTHPFLVERSTPFAVDIAYRVRDNVWNGVATLELDLADVRLADSAASSGPVSRNATLTGLAMLSSVAAS